MNGKVIFTENTRYNDIEYRPGKSVVYKRSMQVAKEQKQQYNTIHFIESSNNKNLAIANRSRVSCAHNLSRAYP